MKRKTDAQKFIPFIEDFEKEADNFLCHYGMEEAIRTPMRIPIEHIALNRMSLELIDSEYLSTDGSVMGATVFHSGFVDVYDPQDESFSGLPVSAATILIDAGITNIGRKRNAIAHECFHWYKHRPYFIYRAANDASTGIAFRCDLNYAQSRIKDLSWTPEEIMEWQANKIAPKILMPRDAFHKKIEEFQGNIYDENHIVEKLASFFGVSIQSARIRMKELGYTLSDRVAEYTEEYDSKSCGKKSIKDPVPAAIEDVFEVYTNDENLRDILNTGQIRYADGFLILNESEYIYKADGEQHITDEARAKLSKCVIGFTEKYLRQYEVPLDNGLLYRSEAKYTRRLETDRSPQNSHIYDKAQQLEHLQVRFEERFEKSIEMNMTSNQLLLEHMKRAGWNTTIFLDKTLLSEIDYSRVKQPNHHFKKDTLMAMAVGLELSLPEFEKVLKLAGLALSETNRLDLAYEFILTAMQGRSIYECNDFLESRNLPTLGTKSRV